MLFARGQFYSRCRIDPGRALLHSTSSENQSSDDLSRLYSPGIRDTANLRRLRLAEHYRFWRKPPTELAGILIFRDRFLAFLVSVGGRDHGTTVHKEMAVLGLRNSQSVLVIRHVFTAGIWAVRIAHHARRAAFHPVLLSRSMDLSVFAEDTVTDHLLSHGGSADGV